MSNSPIPYETSYTQNRELSWLRFNQRVMEEATDLSVPLFERLKFLAIFTNNLDEFFMIRVGSLLDLSHLKKDTYDDKTGWTPMEQLLRVFYAVAPLYEQRDRLFFEIENTLNKYGVRQAELQELSASDLEFVEDHFRKNILPLLSPHIIGAHHPFPHLWNKVPYIVAGVRYKNKNATTGMVSIPDVLPKLLELPGSNGQFIRTEKIVMHFLEEIFPSYEVTDRCIVSVTRNADINPEDEAFDFDEDFRSRMKQILKKRSKLAPVRLEVEGTLGKKQSKLLLRQLDLLPEQVFSFRSPICLDYVYGLKDVISPGLMKKWTYSTFTSIRPPFYKRNESMIQQVKNKDMLLFYPYDSMEPFLHLLKESSTSRKVQSLKITIYRLAPHSQIIKYLSDAAENGKEVTALIELRARFDENNNILWAEQLEKAGCNVIYGMDEYKVHSKVCLITMVDRGKVSYITQMGTGNYNEQTAKQYTDLSLLTANEEIGRDAALFFKNMAIAKLGGTYDHLLVAPPTFHKKLLSLIDEEIAKARKGESGKILFKINSLTEREIIDKLSEASNAGVKIILMIRGICCLLPGVKGKTENIRVFSTVGRFLEHSRIFTFGAGKEAKIYISSADLMTRNMHHRVEIAAPVMDSHARKRIIHILNVELLDNVKSRELDVQGRYIKTKPGKKLERTLDSQVYFMKEALEVQRRKKKEKKRPQGMWMWKILYLLLKRLGRI